MKLWDDTPSGEGQSLLRRCAGGKEASVRTGRILTVPKCTRQIVGSLTYSQFGCRALSPRLFPAQWPTFTFPSNYTSWCTPIYSEHACIFSKKWEKLGKKHKIPEAETIDLSRFGMKAGILCPFPEQLITSQFLPGDLLLESRYFVSSNIFISI